ncbi:helix-turn-helix domain-containing protein [Acuticoccus sp. MNP-M23]|uniref:helix-turn-helix domain-containing protein n=1 Tax=Acuticoccus sp. MNP-M23 TaxID=3072793 RepID=UPI0028151D4D|nr:helix-turn-helix domain-containing protein [Acuticoccus sp. MNP-M23]WMS41337.1 helix-turn-helix domain-containing protein [Acuticoccus sp. MNP-M23]
MPVSIAMTSVRGLGPLPGLIEARAGEEVARRAMERVGVLRMPDDMPAPMMPLKDMVSLFDLAATVTGDGLIGLEAGRDMDEFGSWTVYARAAGTLRECLGRLIRGLAYHQSGAALFLSREGPLARLAYHVPIGSPQHRAQHAEHTIPPLLTTFRLYLGPDWSPDRIEVDYPRTRRLLAVSESLAVPIIADAPAPAIVFPAEALDARRLAPQITPPLSLGELRTMVRERAPRTVSGTVSAVVETRLAHGGANLSVVAAHLGLSERTLQRRLGQEGTHFNTLVDEVRLKQAERLLQRDDIQITEVAFRLGFSDPAHFTRAFRRLTSHTPTLYRKALRQHGRAPNDRSA